MKIAFVLGGSTYQQSLYRVTYDVAEEIRRQGHRVDFIFWENPGPIKGNDKYLEIFGLNKESKPSKIFLALFTAIFGKHFYYYLFSPLFLKQIKAKLKSEKYQAIFYQGQSCIPSTPTKTNTTLWCTAASMRISSSAIADFESVSINGYIKIFIADRSF